MKFEDIVWMAIFLGMFIGFIKLMAAMIRYSNNYWTNFAKCDHTGENHDRIACEQHKQFMVWMWWNNRR